jgi:hypothetical protein
MMALIERKARLPDHRTGNDDLADPAAGVRPRLRAVHDPAQRIQLVRVVARAGNVIHDLRQSDAGRIQIRERRFQRRPVGNTKKFVAVERDDEVPGKIIKRTLDEVRHGRALIEDTVAFAAQHQRQSFVRQSAEDVRGRIRAAMIENIKSVKKCRIVPNE